MGSRHIEKDEYDPDYTWWSPPLPPEEEAARNALMAIQAIEWQKIADEQRAKELLVKLPAIEAASAEWDRLVGLGMTPTDKKITTNASNSLEYYTLRDGDISVQVVAWWFTTGIKIGGGFRYGPPCGMVKVTRYRAGKVLDVRKIQVPANVSIMIANKFR